MAHMLANRADGRTAMAYLGSEGKPWHGLGDALPADASIEAWTKAAGMDFDIKRAMVRYPRNAADVSKPDAWVTMQDRHVLSRSDNDKALGIVSDKYEIVAPKQVMEFFRDLTADAGFRMDTAGVLFDGRQFWALAQVTGDVAIRDKADKVGGYLLLSTSADGTLATEGRWTTVRVVCHNTLSAARSFGGKSAVKVKHRTVFDGDSLKASLGISAHDAREGMQRTMDDFRRLAGRKLTNAERAQMTMEIFGLDTAKMERKDVEKALKRPTVDRVLSLAQGNGLIGANMDGAADTAWGWLNAVTQYTDHHAGRASSEPSVRLSNAWFGKGNDLKEVAYEVAMKHAGGSVTTYAPAPEDGGSLLDQVLSLPVGG